VSFQLASRANRKLETYATYFLADPSSGGTPINNNHSRRRTLSVSVSPEGELHDAALIGPNRAFGTETFFDEVPVTIVDLIRRVCAA